MQLFRRVLREIAYSIVDNYCVNFTDLLQNICAPSMELRGRQSVSRWRIGGGVAPARGTKQGKCDLEQQTLSGQPAAQRRPFQQCSSQAVPHAGAIG